MDVGYGGADDLFLHAKAIWSFLTTGAFPWMVATHSGLTGSQSGWLLVSANLYLMIIVATSACPSQHVLKLPSGGPED